MATLSPTAREVLASAADNLPDGWRTVAPHLAARPGARVLVVGGGFGSVPLYAVAAAVTLGASEVVFVDSDAGRLALAAALGATPRAWVPNAATRVFAQFPITVDASCDPAGLSLALGSVEPGGVYTSASISFEPTTPVPLRAMYTRGVTFITGRVNARAALPAVLDLIGGGRFAPERVTSRVVPFADAAEAIFDPGPKVVFVSDEGERT
jgi:alcohol dehydrogenase